MCQRFNLSLIAAVIFSACYVSNASAEAAPDCAKALTPDINDIRSDIQLLSSYLQTIDQSNFESAKQNGSLQAAFIVYGVPFDIGADFSKFNQARSSFFQKTEYSQNYKNASAYLMQKVPQAAFKAYSDCILAQSINKIGPHLIPRSITDDLIVLDMVWTAQPGIAKGKASWSISGLKEQGELPKSVASNGKYPVLFKRIEKQDASVTVTVADLGDSFLFQYVTPIKVTPPKREKYVQMRNYKTDGGDRQLISVMCPADYHLLDNKGICNLSVPGTLTNSSAIGNVGWQCGWSNWQPVGVALDVQVTCEIDQGKQ